jgi:hypothetical protein
MKNNAVPKILEPRVIIKKEGNIYYTTSSSVDINILIRAAGVS